MPEKVSSMAVRPEVMSVREVVEYLRLGRNTVYEAIRRRELPSVRVGRRVLVPRDALDEFLHGQANHPDAERRAAR